MLQFVCKREIGIVLVLSCGCWLSLLSNDGVWLVGGNLLVSDSEIWGLTILDFCWCHGVLQMHQLCQQWW